MANHPQDTASDPALEEAVEWFVRRDAGNLSEAERTAFEAWLAADPAHARTYAEVGRTWADLDRLPAGRAPRLHAAGVGANVDATDELGAAPAICRRRAWRRLVGTAVAAGLGLLLVFGWDLPTRLRADAVSGTGETLSLTLPDGSTVLLNTNSALALEYSPGQRRVRLLRGEAAFTVAKDARRPFVVEADSGRSTALGTVFLVRRLDSGATVTVLESRVAVEYGRMSGDGQKAVLAPGQRIAYTVGRGLGRVETVDPQVAAAWRRGKLIFVDRPLGEVIDELDRYHRGEIRVVDSLRDRKVTGVFETRDPLAVVDALETTLGIRSTRLSSLLVLLHQ